MRPGRLEEHQAPQRPEALQAAWIDAYAAAGPEPKSSGSGPIPWPRPQAGSRASGDARAAWQRWHHAEAANFNAAQWPWYASLERARCETLAARHLPGIRHNLRPHRELAPEPPAMAALYLAARHLLDHQPWPQPILGRPALWQRLTRRLLAHRRPSTLDDATLRATLEAAVPLLEAPDAFAAHLAPLIRALSESGLADDPDPTAPGTAGEEVDPTGPSEADDANAQPEEADEASDTTPSPEPAEEGRQDSAYRSWSRRLDEERRAADWQPYPQATPLPPLPAHQRQRLQRLAHRLQRELLAARQRYWHFDQEEGRLDSRRVARLIGPRPNHRIFRQEQEAEVPEACVTLLVDHSASLGTEQRLMAAQAIDLAVQVLERCQVRCEVLGFTTRFKGGPGGKAGDNPLHRGWQQAGRPEAPGRLNALRHIVYKGADQPWRRARPYLGLLLNAEFGAENIDGEALAWAANRLLRQPQPRRVLIVLSDGSPFDAATAEANGRHYLEEHLRQIIAAVEDSPIQLTAIGTGFDVGRFYRRAITLHHDEAVAETLFAQLSTLLRQPSQD